MSWQELLGQEKSFLAAVARTALAGLVRTLEVAGELAPPDDPGQAACRRLTDELSRWLAPATADLVRSFAADPAVRAELGEWRPADDPTALWLQIQLALLRLPQPLADRWREPLLRLAGTGTGAAMTVLPGVEVEVVFPGLGEMPGLRLDPSGPVDDRLGAPPLPPIAGRLAGPATLLLWLTERDPALHHALRSVYRFGIIGLAGAQKSKYQRALIERFHRFAEAEKGSDMAELVLAWVELDEALHALLYLPVPSASSWWGRYLARARETMLQVRERAVAAGKTIHLQTLTGRYAEVISCTDPDADCEAAASVPPGDVVRCLRVFLRMDGTAHKGRVLYRSR